MLDNIGVLGELTGSTLPRGLTEHRLREFDGAMDLARNLSLLVALLVLMASSGFLVVQAVTVIKAVMQIAL